MKLSFKKTWMVILTLLALTFSSIGVTPAHAAAGPRYAVPVGGMTSGACGSWGNACDLQYALTVMLEVSASELWVKEGTYQPTVPKGRTATFTLIPGVSMYGGFAGTETSLSQRNLAAHVTILSGEIGKAGNSDNSYHVVTGANGATLDGFTITAGNANGSTSDYTVWGGGIFDLSDTDTLTVTNCILSGNSASQGGGGIASSGTLNITNSTFFGNSATWGGGIYSGGTLNITNSTFSGNSASWWGGGISNEGGTLTITNSTLSGNSASAGSNGGGIFNRIDAAWGTVTLRNTIVANNTSGGNCGGTIINGGNNIDDGTTCGWGSTSGSMSSSIPLLGALANNGGPTQTFALLTGSPAIDGVTFNAPNSAPSTDQRGVARPQGTHYDIGSYEFVENTPKKAGFPWLLLLLGN